MCLYKTFENINIYATSFLKIHIHYNTCKKCFRVYPLFIRDFTKISNFNKSLVKTKYDLNIHTTKAKRNVYLDLSFLPQETLLIYT